MTSVATYRRLGSGRLALLVLVSGLGITCLTAQNQAAAEAKPTPKAETAETHLGRGMELLEKGVFHEAANEFRAALKLDPALQPARFHLGVCLLRLGEREASRQEFLRLRSEIGDEPGVMYCLGRLDLLDGKFDSAIRHLEEAIRQPPFLDTAFYLGAAYLEKGEFDPAEKWLRKAAELTPRDPRVPDLLVRLYQRTGRPVEAQKALSLAAGLRGRPGDRNQLAAACTRALESRPLEEARRECQPLLDPEDPEKLATLGHLYVVFGHYADAIEPLRRAAELSPESFEVHRNLGTSYFQLKRYVEARTVFEKAVKLRPDLFIANALLGATLYALDEEDSAYAVLSHAYDLNPEHRETAALLFKVTTVKAQASCNDKNYSQCLNYLRRAAEIRPDDPAIRRRLAEVSPLAKEQPRTGAEKPRP